jgi:hypothetical protein
MTTKQYIFNLFFNFKDNENGLTREREWAEGKREDALAYLKRLFENKAQFSCIAKDENRSASCLMLRGYVNLNSPCTQAYAKQLLGRYSTCKPSFFGDMVSLCRFIHVDRDLTVTGRLPHGRKLKAFAGDPKFVIKILLDSIDKKDFELQKGRNGDKGTGAVDRNGGKGTGAVDKAVDSEGAGTEAVDS